MVLGANPRVLVGLTPPEQRVHWCGDPAHPAPAPPWAGWRFRLLPATDGGAISNLTTSAREFPVFVGTGHDSTGALYTTKRIRIVPAIAEADSLGSNPWGPALSGDGHAYLSDGEAVWRYDLADATGAPDSVTVGAYPVLAPDGGTLYFARPTITDSTETVTVVPWTLFVACTQTMVRYLVDGWTLYSRDLASGAEQALGDGAEPSLAPGGRLLVRRPDGIYLTDLSGGEQLLMADATASTPIESPDGRLLVFTSRRSGNADIFVLHLE